MQVLEVVLTPLIHAKSFNLMYKMLDLDEYYVQIQFLAAL